MLFDLRLTGTGAQLGARHRTVMARLLPWTRLGFAIMVATGLLLFYATPVRNYQNIFFRAKMVLMLLAGAQRLAVPPRHLSPRARVG